MDLTFTPAEEEFRKRVATWLDENAPDGPLASPTTPDGLRDHLTWERRLLAAGFAAPGWPEEYGGLGLDLWSETVFDEEYVARRLPERLNKMALIHGARTVMAHGTADQKDRWLPGVLDCTDIWCQGFSEPGAGSDLAGLRTTGRIDGDEIVLDGQKTWTSNGAIATRMYALVRTDPEAPKRRGISFLVFDLDADGIEVRPMRQLHGNPGFADVFFSGARVPRSSIVGEPGDGWRIAQTALKLERGTSRGSHTRLLGHLDDLVEVVRGAGGDRALLERLGTVRAWTYAYVHATYALTDTAVRGADDGVASSVNKLRSTELHTAIAELHLEILGGDAQLVDVLGPAGELSGFHRDYWHGRAAEIYAGTNEIQKNIIAERGLGLPREGTT